MKGHLSSLQLDELALNALPAAEAEAARAHLEACPACRADAQALAEGRAHFSAAVLPKTMGAVRRRADSPRRKPAWFAALAAVCAAAAAVLLIPRSPDTDLAAKGGPSITAFYKRGDRIAPAEGAELRAGDAVRLTVHAGAQGHLVVLSIDGAGHVTRWYSGEVAPEARFDLPGSIVLDASPGPERIFALFSSQPQDPAQLERELQRAGRLSGPGIVSLTLEKK